jgi:UDP-N-acetylglucosamine 3-dehydrogenase
MAQPVTPVRLAILGAGHIGARHAACAQQIPEAEVVAVWSRTPSHAAALADKVGARTCDTLEDVAGAPDVDAAIVCTPNAFHAEAAVAMARGGKHVICEKPLARTLAQAEEIIQATEDAGVLLLVAHVLRFYPAFRRLYDLIQGGAVGQPAVIRMGRETAKSPTGWRTDLAVSGGALLEMGVHDFDWLLWACGRAQRVYCRAISRDGHSAPDYALTTVRLWSGAIAHIESSMVGSTGFRTHGEIAGDAGLLAYDSDQDTALRVHLPEAQVSGAVQIPTTHTVESPFVTQLRHFCRCIRGQEEPLITPQEALDALRLGLAALESAESGRAVSL